MKTFQDKNLLMLKHGSMTWCMSSETKSNVVDSCKMGDSSLTH